MLESLGGDRSKLVIDLSCRRLCEERWVVAMNKWQTLTDMEINQGKWRAPLVLHTVVGLLYSLNPPARVHQVSGAVLLRISRARGGQRGPAEGDRREAGGAPGTVVRASRHVRRRRQESGRPRGREEA